MALQIGITPQVFDDWSRAQEKAAAGGIYPASLYVDEQGRIIGDAYDGPKVLGIWGGERAGLASDAYNAQMFAQPAADGFDLPDWLKRAIYAVRQALRDLAAKLGLSSTMAIIIFAVLFLLFLLIFGGR